MKGVGKGGLEVTCDETVLMEEAMGEVEARW